MMMSSVIDSSRIPHGESVLSNSYNYSKQVEKVGHGLEMPALFCVCRLGIQHVETSNAIPNDLFGLELCENMTLRIGDGISVADEIVERCLRTMRAGETCLVQFTVLDRTVELRISLEEFGEPLPAPIWCMTSEHLMAEAVRFKTKGVELYRSRPEWASRQFVKAAKMLMAAPSTGNGHCELLLSQCHANLAACQLLAGNHEHAIVNCDRALALDADNVKCRYRRAMAAIGLQNYEEAADDLKDILRNDPTNSAAIQLMDTLKEKTRAYDKSLGKALSKMFS